jgi:hypothetical protein
VYFVQGLKKNLLSISSFDDKGFRVAFVDGQVLLWPKSSSIDSSIDSTTLIGVREGGLYKLKGHQEQSLVHNSASSSELWHRRLACSPKSQSVTSSKQDGYRSTRYAART